jgi:biotin synthase
MDAKDILAVVQDEAGQENLFRQADEVRRRYCGDVAQLRGVVHFSNCCCRDDLYCGLRKSNKDITRFRMTGDQIVETALAIGDMDRMLRVFALTRIVTGNTHLAAANNCTA